MKFWNRKSKAKKEAEPKQFFLEGSDIGTAVDNDMQATVTFTEMEDGWAWVLESYSPGFTVSGMSETYQKANHDSREELRKICNAYGLTSRRFGLIYELNEMTHRQSLHAARKRDA